MFHKFGFKNKNQMNKVNAAKKAVEKWQQRGRAAVVVDPAAGTVSGVDDPCSLTKSKLQHLSRVSVLFLIVVGEVDSGRNGG